MYKIGICDDDEQFLLLLIEEIKKILDVSGLVRGENYDVEGYTTPEPMMKAILNNEVSYQLLLLDVEINGKNGMELAKQLRENGICFSLIYISFYRDYIYDCFGTQPLWYLIKPLDLEKLKEIICQDYRQRYQNERLYLKSEGRQIAILYKDIYALESFQHKTKIWLCDTTAEWRGSLTSLKAMVPSWCFCQCHNSYLINFTHVTELLKTDVRMDNGTSFPISRRMYQNTLEKYFSYLKL